MTLQIEKTITTTRTAISLDVVGVQQIKTPDGWVAIIEGVIGYDDGGSDRVQVTKTGDTYNLFWMNYNSGVYIYQVLISGLDIDTVISESVEASFLNSI